MSLAVVLCSYNGAMYIAEQLQSIERQTVPPERLVIYDWGSRDGTIEEIQAFISTSKLEVRLMEMNEPKGVYNSFKQAIKDLLLQYPEISYVALSDQDDLWEPNKLEIAREYLFEAKGSSAIFFSDVSIVAADGAVIDHSRFFSSDYFSSRPNRFNDALFLASPVIGMTLVVSKDIAQEFVSIPSENQFMHDWSMVLCSVMLESKVYYFDSPLVRYRQHSNNVLGASSKKTKLHLLRSMFQRMLMLERQYEVFKKRYPSRLPKSFFSIYMVKSALSAGFLRVRYRAALALFLLLFWVGRPFKFILCDNE